MFKSVKEDLWKRMLERKKISYEQYLMLLTEEKPLRTKRDMENLNSFKEYYNNDI